MLFNHLVLCCPLLLWPSVFPSIRVFSTKLALQIRWSNYWSFSICPSNEYSGLICFRIDWFDLLQSKGLSRFCSSTTVWKHQFFSVPCSVFFMVQFSTSVNDYWKNLSLGVYGPLLAKPYPCFLICCLGLSSLSFQGALLCMTSANL